MYFLCYVYPDFADNKNVHCYKYAVSGSFLVRLQIDLNLKQQFQVGIFLDLGVMAINKPDQIV